MNAQNLNLLRTLFVQAKNDNQDIEQELDDMTNYLRCLEKCVADGNWRIAFAGRSNVGKSTIINGLLGYDVAPDRNGPCTAAIVEYNYAKNFSVTIRYPGESVAKVEDFRSDKELREFLTSNAAVTEYCEQASAPHIVVKLPSPLLKKQIVIYDTPGFDATKGGDDESGGIHDEIIDGFITLHSRDTAIFWVLRENPRDNEIEFLKKYDKQSFLRYMIINIDAEHDNEEYREKYRRKYADSLHLRRNDIFVDAMSPKSISTLKRKISGFIDYSGGVAERIKGFATDCRDLKHCTVKWRRTTLAMIVAECKKSGCADMINAVDKLVEIRKK